MHSAVCFVSIVSIIILISDVGFASHLQWIRLTEDNFTSDIRNHPFVVCISTVPWCGESRRIMKELVKSIEADQKLHSVVELRVIFVNLDKELALAVLGRRKTPVLTFYLNATPYKYEGRLKVENILAAMHQGTFISSRDFPFRRLESKLDVEKFLEFTEKAVILYDNCNYAEKLAGRNWHRMVNKASNSLQDVLDELPSVFHKHPDIYGENDNVNFRRLQSDEIHVQQSSSSSRNVSQECLLNNSVSSNLSSADDIDIVASGISKSKSAFLDSESLRVLAVDIDKGLNSETCGSFTENLLHAEGDLLDQSMACQVKIPSSCQGSSFSNCQPSASSLTKFSHANLSICNSFGHIHGCNSTDYRHFAILYQNLTKLARSHVLTPERMDFAIIKNRGLFLDLGIHKYQNNTWLLIIRTMDQPNAPKVYMENETLDSFVSHSRQLISELKHDRAHYYSLMEEKPAAILFIDRASPLHEVRVKSWDALRAFQSVVREIEATTDSKGNDYQSGDNELQEKEVVIATIAEKELFSTITDVKTSLDNSASTDTILKRDHSDFKEEKQSNKRKDLHQEVDNHDNALIVKVLFREQKMQMEASLLETSSDDFRSVDLKNVIFSENNVVYESQSGEIDEIIVHQSPMNEMQSISLQLSTGQKMQTSSEIDIAEEAVSEKRQNLDYMHSLSYFFSDGDDSMKEILLPGFSYPCLLILDPYKNGQFIFPINLQPLSYATIKTFIYQFSRGLLERVYQSGLAPRGPRQQVKPPFVNRDFHVINGVPKITMKKLSEILSDSEMPDCALDLIKEEICHAKKRDILVHFTLSACGFCKRMELVFREMHQLLTLHSDACLKNKGMLLNADGKHSECMTDGWNNFHGKASFANGDWYRWSEKLPLLFEIDCTMNECSFFFEGVDQEKYPSAILFSKTRDSKAVYEGGPTMHGLLEFIAYQSSIDVLQVIQGSSLPYRSHQCV